MKFIIISIIIINIISAPCLTSFRNIHKLLAIAKQSFCKFAVASKQHFDGLNVNASTIDKLININLFNAAAIQRLGMIELKALDFSSVDTAIILAWADQNLKERDIEEARKRKEEEREAARLLDIFKREKREEDMKVRKALKLASRKTIHVFNDEGKYFIYAIEDQFEYEKVLSVFSGLLEVTLDMNVLDSRVILSWEDLHDKKLYVPANTKRSDVESLRAEILNLAKSKAEYSAKSHLREHFNLNSSSDVEFLGSEIELRAKNGTALGDVGTLYRIRSHRMFILMERKTSVGVNATASLEEQVGHVTANSTVNPY